MEKQISIIIPTYNMEKYLNKCLDSLLIPELDQVEVLVVNDGSKDGSSEIAHSYESRYPDSFRVIDKQNGNYGSCINAALPLVKGRYVKILDADDSFDTKAFNEFVRLLPEMNVDVIFTGFNKVDEEGNEINKINSTSEKKILNRNLSLSDLPVDVLASSSQMHKITYLTEVFQRFTYHQTEGISYTDTEWAILPLSFCTTFYYLDLQLYQYLYGRDGQTMSAESIKRNFNNFCIVGKKLISDYLMQHEHIKNKSFLRKRIQNYCLLIFRLSLKSWDCDVAMDLKDFDIYIKEKIPQVYQNLMLIPYDEISHFKFIKYIRQKNYSNKMQIPFMVKLKLSIKYRLRRILNR